MKKVITDYLNQASMNFKLLDRESNNIEKSANIIIKALKNNNKIIQILNKNNFNIITEADLTKAAKQAVEMAK